MYGEARAFTADANKIIHHPVALTDFFPSISADTQSSETEEIWQKWSQSSWPKTGNTDTCYQFKPNVPSRCPPVPCDCAITKAAAASFRLSRPRQKTKANWALQNQQEVKQHFLLWAHLAVNYMKVKINLCTCLHFNQFSSLFVCSYDRKKEG